MTFSDTVVSYCIRDRKLDLKIALRMYIYYYENIWNLQDQIIVAEFENLITNYDSIIEKVNIKWRRSFKPFVNKKENVEKVFNEIRMINKLKYNSLKNYIAIPEETRENEKEELINQIKDKRFQNLLTKAWNVYEKISSR